MEVPLNALDRNPLQKRSVILPSHHLWERRELQSSQKEEGRKVEIRTFLDAHSVVYSPRLGISKLEALSAELDAHLTATKAAETAEEAKTAEEAVTEDISKDDHGS